MNRETFDKGVNILSMIRDLKDDIEVMEKNKPISLSIMYNCAGAGIRLNEGYIEELAKERLKEFKEQLKGLKEDFENL